MGPRFERISPTVDTVHQLEQTLLKRLPDSVHILVLLKLASQQRFPNEVNVQFYIYRNGEGEDENEEASEGDNPFIICIQRPNFHTKKGVILLTPRNPTEEQVTIFDNFIGWSEPQIFQCVQPSFWSIILKLCRSHGKLSPTDSTGIPGVFFAMTDLEKARSLDVNDFSNNPNVVVRPLEKSDVPLVAEQWKWAAPHSEEVIRYCVGSLISCGVFESGEMASSVLLSPLGAFNALYTADKFRNMGLGKFVMKWISREGAREMGTFPLAEIEVWNDPSRSVLTKAGYEEMYLTKWYYYEPSNC